MSEPARKPMTWDEYLTFEAGETLRHELVNGDVRAMGGGTDDHDGICNNLRAALRTQMRGSRCRLRGPDLKVATGNGNARYPDALIDSGERPRGGLTARQPTVVFEVLSRSTSWKDQNEKFYDYDMTPSIARYVLIFQDEMRAMVYVRSAEGPLSRITSEVLTTPEAMLNLPEVELSLALAELYEGME